jgi:hypothetical protein
VTALEAVLMGRAARAGALQRLRSSDSEEALRALAQLGAEPLSRNRHCPKCQTQAREHWLAARERELLATRYFHVVFTVPHELNVLALDNPRLFYDLLFTASAQTLLKVRPRYAFFLPVKVLSRVFRGNHAARLTAVGTLAVRLLRFLLMPRPPAERRRASCTPTHLCVWALSKTFPVHLRHVIRAVLQTISAASTYRIRTLVVGRQLNPRFSRHKSGIQFP